VVIALFYSLPYKIGTVESSLLMYFYHDDAPEAPVQNPMFVDETALTSTPIDISELINDAHLGLK
jgi:hypothetical protein